MVVAIERLGVAMLDEAPVARVCRRVCIVNDEVASESCSSSAATCRKQPLHDARA